MPEPGRSWWWMGWWRVALGVAVPLAVTVALAIAVALMAPPVALAAENHPPLTVEMLRQRLANPVQREGRPAIDLRYPLFTLGFLFGRLVPVPAVLIGLMIRQGRYHDLMTESYFVEDGSLRQLRLLIARLPVIPKFPFFRDRYTY